MTRTPLIAGNWKMHGRADWASRMGELRAAVSRDDVELLVCPPHVYVGMLAGKGVAVGGQDCHAEEAGAHTGEVAAEMLRDVGAEYVIVGHSERRAASETDADVVAKAEAAQRAGLVPIVCVGESLHEREAGRATEVVLGQLQASLPESGDYVVAYEPLWAIGTGKVATVRDIADMHAAIRERVGEGVRILYGGSVKPGNAEQVLGTPDVDGALVGGASLEVESFAAIAEAAPR